MEKYELTKCRICGSEVKKFLDIGKCHPPEEFRKKEELNKPIVTYPLGLSYCPKCGEVQLNAEIPPDVIYKENFFFDGSITKISAHYTDLAKLIVERYTPAKEDLIVDVGSNTGKLLMAFQEMGYKNVVGVDPATKLVEIAIKNGVPTFDDYFTQAAAERVEKKHGKAKIITCNNTFDHVTDLHDYMNGIKALLREDGVFIVEDPYFATFLQTLGHVVYHQQLDYILVRPFTKLFEDHGMELIDCDKFVGPHGGEIRLYIGFRGKHRVSEHVSQFIAEEDKLLNEREKALKRFANGVLEQRDEMVKLLKKLKSEGKSIAAIGASAKGNTLLFYSGVGPETIDFITELSPLKVGRYTPSGIPIVEESELTKRQPDYAVVLAWNNFNDQLREKFKGFTDKGGEFIVPIPKLRVVGK